ncbi:hypothetical protein E2C01_070057 [Portunus trituberculatus]|uniref:Uncharacterized protein n=1 Tax=Portunus trituberculatus TaxID=210409 RepID=A0A5B7I4F4_PORTR|nr:hypothetical protein [Portunus trituberculatus]
MTGRPAAPRLAARRVAAVAHFIPDLCPIVPQLKGLFIPHLDRLQHCQTVIQQHLTARWETF